MQSQKNLRFSLPVTISLALSLFSRSIQFYFQFEQAKRRNNQVYGKPNNCTEALWRNGNRSNAIHFIAFIKTLKSQTANGTRFT